MVELYTLKMYKLRDRSQQFCKSFKYTLFDVLFCKYSTEHLGYKILFSTSETVFYYGSSLLLIEHLLLSMLGGEGGEVKQF